MNQKTRIIIVMIIGIALILMFMIVLVILISGSVRDLKEELQQKECPIPEFPDTLTIKSQNKTQFNLYINEEIIGEYETNATFTDKGYEVEIFQKLNKPIIVLKADSLVVGNKITVKYLNKTTIKKVGCYGHMFIGLD